MAWFWWLIGVVVIVMWVVAVVDIVRCRHARSGGKTAAWVILILILPVLGTFLYFLVNGVAGGRETPAGDYTRPGGGLGP
jgi:Phospholipase_D-nuclease N-terminal